MNLSSCISIRTDDQLEIIKHVANLLQSSSLVHFEGVKDGGLLMKSDLRFKSRRLSVSRPFSLLCATRPKGNNTARGFYLKRSQGLPDCLGLTLC